MTAYLTLTADSGLTISDVAAWLDRARSLGADESAPVWVGAPPRTTALPTTDHASLPITSADDADGSRAALTVQVSVRRRVLPPGSDVARASSRAEPVGSAPSATPG